ncbi:hypothetical protein Tco_1273567 [Tanacetum coccineum]
MASVNEGVVDGSQSQSQPPSNDASVSAHLYVNVEILFDSTVKGIVNVHTSITVSMTEERILKKKAKNDQTKHGMEKTKSIRSQKAATVRKTCKYRKEFKRNLLDRFAVATSRSRYRSCSKLDNRCLGNLVKWEAIVVNCVRIQRTWAQQADRDTYSASAVDSAVQSCFFEDQLTSFSPRNCAPPEVLLKVSLHPA